MDSHAASRSGHSAVLLRSDTKRTRNVGHYLYVFGGRESSEVDVVGHWGKDEVQVGFGGPTFGKPIAGLSSSFDEPEIW